MSKITEFYAGTGRDQNGRTLADIHKFDMNRLERDHQYIQWLFPVPEPSRFNNGAPLLTAEDMQAFRASPELRANLLQSLARMEAFYGFWGNTPDKKLARHQFFNECANNWLTPNNHNFLRISRILRCASLLGLQEEARDFLRVLEDVYNEGGHAVISPATLGYWRRAVEPPELKLGAAPAPRP